MVQFISITVNPERDSFPALRAYTDRYKANHDHWWFLTGDKKTIYNFIRNDLRYTGQGREMAGPMILSIPTNLCCWTRTGIYAAIMMA